MSILSIHQSRLNQIEKEIADLTTKIASEEKNIYEKERLINNVKKSINSNTSLSSLKSKSSQMEGYQRYISTCQSRIIDFRKKMAMKQKNAINIKESIRREEDSMRKKEQQEQAKYNREQVRFQEYLKNDLLKARNEIGRLLSVKKEANSHNTQDESNNSSFDFFVSHASEDKDGFVRKLVDALKAENIKVWYDESELTIGDSLRKEIDKGLSHSRFGIVVISPSFIKKQWTEYELNGLTAIENTRGKTILPVWHKITKDEVLDFSPSLADKYALNSSIHNISEMVIELKKLIKN